MTAEILQAERLTLTLGYLATGNSQVIALLSIIHHSSSYLNLFLLLLECQISLSFSFQMVSPHLALLENGNGNNMNGRLRADSDPCSGLEPLSCAGSNRLFLIIVPLMMFQ